MLRLSRRAAGRAHLTEYARSAKTDVRKWIVQLESLMAALVLLVCTCSGVAPSYTEGSQAGWSNRAGAGLRAYSYLGTSNFI